MTTAMKAAKAAWHQEIQEKVSSHQETYERFRIFMEPFFNRMLWDKPVAGIARRPQCSVRLPLLGDGDATLVVRPRWIKGRGVVPGITTEVVIKAAFMGSVVAKVHLGVAIGEDQCRWSRWTRRTGEELLTRMVEGMGDFMSDPEAVFQRSKGFCCCCGRHLTDEVSRSRGIGPECIKIWQ